MIIYVHSFLIERLRRDGTDFEDFPVTNTTECEQDLEQSDVDLIYQPNARVGYFGHRNARYSIIIIIKLVII